MRKEHLWEIILNLDQAFMEILFFFFLKKTEGQIGAQWMMHNGRRMFTIDHIEPST